MAILEINTFPDNPFYTCRVSLDGTEYLFAFSYNGREDRIYLDLKTLEGSIIVRGIKIVTSIPLAASCKDERMPPGALIALSLTDDTPPGLGELGLDRRVQLLYLDAAERHSALVSQ